MIENIVLDMGNVLLDYNPEVPLAAFLDHEEDRAIVRKELFGGPEWVQRDAGMITEEEMFQSVAKRVPGRLHEGLRHCVYEWMICMKPIATAQEFCRKASEAGYGLYVLSNASDNFYSYFTDFAPVEMFRGILVSSEVHLIKPDLRIYQCLLEKYGLEPEKCLFIDDRANNVEAARQAGMQAVLYENDFDKIWEGLV